MDWNTKSDHTEKSFFFFFFLQQRTTLSLLFLCLLRLLASLSRRGKAEWNKNAGKSVFIPLVRCKLVADKYIYYIYIYTNVYYIQRGIAVLEKKGMIKKKSRQNRTTTNLMARKDWRYTAAASLTYVLLLLPCCFIKMLSTLAFAVFLSRQGCCHPARYTCI